MRENRAEKGGITVEYLTAGEKEAVAELKEALQEMLGDRLVGLYLFGSKARGDYDAGSDIDIAVIVRGLTGNLKNAVFDRVADIELERDVCLSTLVLSEEQFEFLKRRERRIARDIERENFIIPKYIGRTQRATYTDCLTDMNEAVNPVV